jgi:hypothetical protein
MPANERQIAGPALRGGGFHTEAGCQMQWSRRRSTAGDKDINMLRNDANSFSHVTKVPGTIAKSNSNVTNVRRIVTKCQETSPTPLESSARYRETSPTC